MKPLSENQKDHIKAAVLHRFLVENGAFGDFVRAMKNLEPERFDEHFLVQDNLVFLNTFIGINLAFDWSTAEENGWGETKKWMTLHYQFDSFYEEEYRNIESFIYESILGYDLQRFFEEQGFGIDLFIAEVVRQKSIKVFKRQVVGVTETKNPIMNGFTWSSAIDIGTSWSTICTSFGSFCESKTEDAAV